MGLLMDGNNAVRGRWAHASVPARNQLFPLFQEPYYRRLCLTIYSLNFPQIPKIKLDFESDLVGIRFFLEDY